MNEIQMKIFFGKLQKHPDGLSTKVLGRLRTIFRNFRGGESYLFIHSIGRQPLIETTSIKTNSMKATSLNTTLMNSNSMEYDLNERTA